MIWRAHSGVLAGALAGALFFILIFGFEHLSPGNIAHLMRGDPAQHFLGWQFFRADAWRFPPGAIRNFGAPEGTSIGFTDSIPLLAIALKPFSGLLPPRFQYLGLWLALSYALHGALSVLLIRRFTSSTLQQLLGASLFILTPFLLFQADAHRALASHWIILWALNLYFEDLTRKSAALWIAVSFTASLTHPYLAAMVLVIMMAWIVRVLLAGRTGMARAALPLLAAFSIAALNSFLAGYFTLPTRSLLYAGYSAYSANLNSPFNPLGGFSSLLNERPLATEQQLDGFAYLGLGQLLLIFCAAVVALIAPPGRQALSRWLPIVCACILMSLFAVSNVVTFDDSVLIRFPLQGILLAAASFFRASGRFIWPALYLALMAAMGLLIRRLKARTCLLLLAALVMLQIVDLRPALQRYQRRYWVESGWESPLRSDFWQSLPGRYRKVIWLPHAHAPKGYEAWALFAADNDMSFSTGYFARIDASRVRQQAALLLGRLMRGELEPDAVYVLADASLIETARAATKPEDVIVTVDGFTVLLPGWARP